MPEIRVRIRVETSADTLLLENNILYVTANGQNYQYNSDDIQKIVLLTTDLGPIYDDLGMAIDVGNYTVIFIMSEHECFKPFLFDQIKDVLPVDYQKVIDASSCFENKVFEIYQKEKLS